MKTPAVKRVRFALIINIVSVVTSLLYVILSLAYFIAMTSMANGNEYEVIESVLTFKVENGMVTEVINDTEKGNGEGFFEVDSDSIITFLVK